MKHPPKGAGCTSGAVSPDCLRYLPTYGPLWGQTSSYGLLWVESRSIEYNWSRHKSYCAICRAPDDWTSFGDVKKKL